LQFEVVKCEADMNFGNSCHITQSSDRPKASGGLVNINAACLSL